MRDLFEIRSSTGRHPVRMTDAPVREAVESCDASLILADSFFREQVEGLERPIIFIEATEEAKEFQALGPLIEQCREQGLARSGQIVALGNDSELDDYTYRVAGCVGEFWTQMCCAHLFPEKPLDDAWLLKNSIRFGKGLQLVNCSFVNESRTSHSMFSERGL